MNAKWMNSGFILVSSRRPSDQKKNNGKTEHFKTTHYFGHKTDQKQADNIYTCNQCHEDNTYSSLISIAKTINGCSMKESQLRDISRTFSNIECMRVEPIKVKLT